MSKAAIVISSLAAIGLLLLGASLLVVGHLFEQLKWHDAFKGTISGLVVVGLATLGWLAFCIYNSLAAEPVGVPVGAVRLSSRLTFYLKFFPPYYLFAVWLTVSIVSHFSAYRAAIYLPLLLFFAGLLGLACYFSYRLRFVYKASGQLILGTYTSLQVLPQADVIVRSNFLLLGSIQAQNRRYIYLPSLTELRSRTRSANQQ